MKFVSFILIIVAISLNASFLSIIKDYLGIDHHTNIKSLPSILKTLKSKIINLYYHSVIKDLESPEFKWIPSYQGSGKPDNKTIDLKPAMCFQKNTITIENFTDKSAALVFTSWTQSSLLCSDIYLIGTLENMEFLVVTGGIQIIEWNFSNSISIAELNDIKRNGFRIFSFNSNLFTTIYQLYETVELFLPALITATVPAATEEQNVAFLKNTVQIIMEKRSTYAVDIDENIIKSGDMLAIIRLDGLDPMLSWAMGSRTGHMVVALRLDDSLVLCESTTNSSYWPTNGVQCTPYATWIKQARTASQNVIYLPLRPDLAAKFDTNAAYAFFQAHEGLDYGYHNLLWGWQDNIGNYMGFLSPELHMLLPALIGKIAPSISDLLWNQAFLNRVRLSNAGNLSTADIYEYAFNMRNWTFNDLSWDVEEDSFEYAMNKNSGGTVEARSQVCNVFVCNIWKAGGIFSDQPEFQCSETTNWDMEAIQIFDDNFVRPAACVSADPTSKFCQLSGNYLVDIPTYNSRWPIPKNAFSNCPRGDAPIYDKPYPC